MIGFLIDVARKILEASDISQSAIPESLNGDKYKIFENLSIYKYGKIQIDCWPPGWHIDHLAHPCTTKFRDFSIR